MFVKAPKQQNILKIPEHFITLTDIAVNGDLTFSIVYNINQSDVVRKSAHHCRITTITKVIKKRNVVIDNPWPKIDNVTVIKNILSLSANARASAKNQETFHVAKVISDNTTIVNNEIIRPLRAGAPLSGITALVKPRIAIKTIRELNLDNNIHPILQVNPPAPPINDSLPPAKHVFQTNLIRRGIDPTHIYDFENDSLSAEESIRGINKKNSSRHINHISPQLVQLAEIQQQITHVPQQQTTTSSVSYSEDTKILTLTTEIADEGEVETSLVILAEKIQDGAGNYKDVYIQFDLLDTSGNTIQTHQEKVEILKHVEIFYTPKLPPIASVAKFDTMTKGNIKIKQIDPSATAVRLFRKNLSYAINQVDDYTFINDYPLKSAAGFDNIPIDVSSGGTTIYRLVPVGIHDNLGSEFANVVIKPFKPVKKITYVSVVTQIVNVGINIEVRQLPPDVVSFRILRRDDTINETAYSIVGDDNIQVNVHDSEALYIVTDNDVKNGHIYEYTSQLIYKNGTITTAGNAIVEYVPLVENLVDTKIENMQVSYDVNNLDVTFKINTTVIETQLDTVKNLLQQQGIEQHFIDELTSEREKLRQLIAHQVHRIDQTAGVRENFGTITSDTFSDSQLRNVNSVSPLQVGHKYRYEIVACLRSAETLFEDFVKQATDDSTKKSYVYSPNKFLHPVTLQKGNVASSDTLKLHYAKDQMAFGSVGNLAQIDVSFADDTTTIVEANAEQFDRKHLLIKWKISGNPGNIDHFIIMREHLGQRKIIGKSHASFQTTNFTYVYTLENFDVGELFFVVQPVYNTYNVGSSVTTNGITLE